MQAWVGVIAALVGIAIGFLLRHLTAKRETERFERDAATLRAQLGVAQSFAEERASFKARADERQKAIERITEERDSALQEVKSAAKVAEIQAGRIGELEKDVENEQKKVEERDVFIRSAKEELANHFQALAGNILDQKTEKFSETSKGEIGTLLEPLKNQLKEFREKVEAVQKDSNTGVAELKGLVGSLSSLNLQLAQEAKNLTTALRGSAKAQGDWGEFILRDLLDKAGLREGEQYSFQQSFSGVDTENGDRTRTVRTDVVVTLPGGRHLVIDSKVSLTAYTDCVSATDDPTRTAALKQHLISVRGHISGLSKAGYHRLSGVESPDFVVMFIPIEPAFLLALQNDENLWADAYRQGILLVGPTTLLYVIRIVNVLWQQELQAKSVRDVMERGSALYEKFVGFVTDLEAIGKGLDAASDSYSRARKKLSEGPGNLVRQVGMLKQLGIRSTKSLPKNLLDIAEAGEPSLAALAASADEAPSENY
jgi:DNA recombination protein RmuC